MTFDTLKEFLVKMKLIEDSSEKGFHLILKNGYTISVQWKPFNYCNSDGLTAEIAVWDSDMNWLSLSEHDDVIGYQTVADALKLAIEISNK